MRTVGAVTLTAAGGSAATGTRQAIAVGAKGVWLQSGVTNAEAKRLAAEAGIDYVENRCIMVEHRRRR